MSILERFRDIDAPPEKVWAGAERFRELPAVNPFIVHAAGELREGERPQRDPSGAGHELVSFKPQLLRVVPGREIRWFGVTYVRGLFDGRHSLTWSRCPAGAAASVRTKT